MYIYLDFACIFGLENVDYLDNTLIWLGMGLYLTT